MLENLLCAASMSTKLKLMKREEICHLLLHRAGHVIVTTLLCKYPK